MEPVAIALICAVSFGAVVEFSVFVRQLLMSRDKKINDESQKRALSQEADELAKIREEMKENKTRFKTHYQVLGTNKEAIQYLDHKIDEILQKKSKLVQRYAQITLQESSAIVNGEENTKRQEQCNHLQTEIDTEIDFYQKEIEHYQTRRDALWDTHREFLDHLVDQEKTRNENLDKLYHKHSGMLQKVILRHNESSEKIATKMIEAGNGDFKAMLMSPVLFLMQYFGLANGTSPDKIKKEIESRTQILDVETDVNGDGFESAHAHKSDDRSETDSELDGFEDSQWEGKWDDYLEDDASLEQSVSMMDG